MLLGERYAENLGVNIRRVRNWLLIITGLLTAVITAFCGPVAFIGLAVPHVARMILGTANHNSLLPVTILSGGAVAIVLQLDLRLARRSGYYPLECRHAHYRCAGHHLRYSEPTEAARIQLIIYVLERGDFWFPMIIEQTEKHPEYSLQSFAVNALYIPH